MDIEKIPIDLRELYRVAAAWRVSYGSEPRFGSGTVEVLIERVATLTNTLVSASHALRSYQYGNASTELAKSCADIIDAAVRSEEEGKDAIQKTK